MHFLSGHPLFFKCQLTFCITEPFVVVGRGKVFWFSLYFFCDFSLSQKKKKSFSNFLFLQIAEFVFPSNLGLAERELWCLSLSAGCHLPQCHLLSPGVCLQQMELFPAPYHGEHVALKSRIFWFPDLPRILNFNFWCLCEVVLTLGKTSKTFSVLT